MEKVVLEQLVKHLVNNELIDVLQSAYRTNTQWKLICWKYRAIYFHPSMKRVLVLLNLSAAFDRIDAFLLSRLHDMYEIHDQALSWIRSYLSDRLLQVNIKLTLSDKQELIFCVPQGSVFCTACILSLCLTSSTVLYYCTIHILITHILFYWQIV